MEEFEQRSLKSSEGLRAADASLDVMGFVSVDDFVLVSANDSDRRYRWYQS